jgi:arsenate reductase (thioredoxin)
MLNILVLCTANSARSILGEALINKLGEGRFKGYSAGSHPRGEPNPDGLAMLKDKGYDISAFSSKNWDVYAGSGAPKMDIVITVCDSAAGETCPLWPGAPVKAHWGIPDPAQNGNTSEERRAAFEETYRLLQMRILALIALPVEAMSPADLGQALAFIGRLDGATAKALEDNA